MFPILFKIGNFTLRTYGVMVALAVVVALIISMKYAEKYKKIDEDTFLNIAIWTIIGGIIGARIFWVLSSPWLSDYLKHPLSILAVWQGGLSFLGMVFGGMIFLLITVKHYKISFLKFLDIGSLGVSIGYGIGKLGCFFNGCCHGVEVVSWWPKAFPFTLVFNNPQSECELLMKPLYPAQLMNSLSGWLTFIVLLWLVKKNKVRYDGHLFFYFAMIFSPMEFFIDYIRYIPTSLAGLTPNQWGAIIMVIIGFIYNYQAKKSSKKEA